MTAGLARIVCASVVLAAGPLWAQAAEQPPSDPGIETQPEPDYAEVAADARKIADEIERRLIEQNMDNAHGFLFESDGVQGHPPADTAYRQMEEMISFCNATGGKAGNCPFKLKITMSLNPGNTIGQLGKGMGMGEGFGGQLGSGANGAAGSRSRFGLYGPRPAGNKSQASSRLGDVKTDAQALRDAGRDPLAGNVEELSTSKRDAGEFTAESGGRVMEEYRPLIEAYFKRLAEEDPRQ